MRIFIVPIVIICVAFTACKSNTENPSKTQPVTAQGYYEKVIDLEETMSEPLLRTEAEIQARSDKSDFDGVAKSAKAMEDTVDTRIRALKRMPPVGKGGEDFKLVAVRYFEYVKSIYTAYKNIGLAKTDDARNEAAKKMQTIINAQPGVMQNLNSIQAKFAGDNNFTIPAD